VLLLNGNWVYCSLVFCCKFKASEVVSEKGVCKESHPVRLLMAFRKRDYHVRYCCATWLIQLVFQDYPKMLLLFLFIKQKSSSPRSQVKILRTYDAEDAGTMILCSHSRFREG
jgi:hypothetical protein